VGALRCRISELGRQENVMQIPAARDALRRDAERASALLEAVQSDLCEIAGGGPA
jgi:hypothetical protein